MPDATRPPQKSWKDIDVAQLVNFAGDRKDLLVNGAVIVFAILAAINIANSHWHQESVYQENIKQMEDKLQVISVYNATTQRTKKFLGQLPKAMPDGRLMSQIAEYAAQNNVEILSFTPGPKTNDPFYQMSKITINVRAREYKDLILFVRTIEKSSYALRVDALSTSLAEGVKDKRGAVMTGSINVVIDIALIKINEDQKT